MMQPSSDIGDLRSAVEPILAEALEAYGSPGQGAEQEVTPALLAQAFGQLLDVFARLDTDRARSGDGQATQSEADLDTRDVTELGEYALSLLNDLGVWINRLGLDARRAALHGLTAGFALWVVRHGGALHTLEPVADALAQLANQTQDPGELKALCTAAGELIDGVAPAIKQDLDNVNPGRPWRVMNLNRGIMATRSEDPATMSEAFDTLVRNLPQDAGQFFAEGMRQMDAVGYPAPVRRVMETYYNQWSRQGALH